MSVAVPPGRNENPVRVFATFTEDLERLTDWLEQCGVTTVALESTGVFWIPIFEILEQRGIRPCLVNARHMKNVPGRRTDWHECQWLQFLHSPEAPTAFVVSTAAPIATGWSDPVPGRAFHPAVDQRYSRRTEMAWLRQPCALP
jgi:hypothetical protein